MDRIAKALNCTLEELRDGIRQQDPPDVQQLLKAYRGLPPDAQQVVLLLVKALARLVRGMKPGVKRQPRKAARS